MVYATCFAALRLPLRMVASVGILTFILVSVELEWLWGFESL